MACFIQLVCRRTSYLPIHPIPIASFEIYNSRLLFLLPKLSLQWLIASHIYEKFKGKVPNIFYRISFYGFKSWREFYLRIMGCWSNGSLKNASRKNQTPLMNQSHGKSASPIKKFFLQIASFSSFLTRGLERSISK